MRLPLLIAAALLTLGGGPAAARHGFHHTYHAHHRSFGHIREGYYTASSGHRVHRPVQASNQPAGASARCRDGSWSFSEHHRGTCSHHGGVASWL